MKYQWGIFFIVHAVEGLNISHYDELISQILKAKLSKEENLAIMILSSCFFLDRGLVIQIKKIEFDKRRMVNITSLLHDEVAGENDNIGNSSFLSVMLEKMKMNCSADRYMMFTWDHGCGFGIFNITPSSQKIKSVLQNLNLREKWENLIPIENVPEIEPENKIPANNRKVTVISNSSPADSSFENILFRADKAIKMSEMHDMELVNLKADIGDDTITDMLTMTELNTAISTVFKNQKIEVLVMMNCWMQMLENGFAFKDSVEILVASETSLLFNAYDYTALFELINENPEKISPEKIAVFCSNSIKKAYDSLEISLSDVVICAVRPAITEKVNNSLTGLFKEFHEHPESKKVEIKKIRRACLDISELDLKVGTPKELLFNFIDLTGFLTLLNEESLISNETYNMFISSANEYVVKDSLLMGDFFNQPVSANNKTIKKANGFLIFHPTTKIMGADYRKKFYTTSSQFCTSFAKKSKWRNYIEEFIEQ